jgi:transmembrane sensor
LENKQQLDQLIARYLNKQCTAAEINILLHEFDQPENEEELKAAILQYFENAGESGSLSDRSIDIALDDVHSRLISQIKQEAPAGRPGSLKLWRVTAAAAAVLVFLSAGLYFYLNRMQPKPSLKAGIAKQSKNDILPGSNKAVLTLANGEQVVLTDAKNGVVAKQGGTAIIKTSDGQVINQVANRTASNEEPIGYNTITTPRGGQYQVVLPDGSKVWLNAASSLKYPTKFSGEERNVELTGEAYFEVAKNAAMPFRVRSAGQIVEVLGTHFNINAYADETLMKTTLLEGSVKINHEQATVVIKPGEQATIVKGASRIAVNEVDTNEATAWRDGYFQFNHADIQTVMRQLSRWYDVDVKYEGTISSNQFGGAIQRKLNLSQVLHILEKSQLRFTIIGKEVRVMP